jgi:hypothetical protein
MGWILQIDGCEYMPSTDVSSMPSSTDSNFATDATLLPYGLVWSQWQISEQAQVTGGGINVAGLTFQLHDLTPTTGSAAGQWWITYLFSRAQSSITQTILTLSLSPTDTTVTVDGTTGFAASGTIWIDREAITYSGVTATTFTGCTRGVLGSVAIAHTINAQTSFAPTVYSSLTSLERRRCSLWRVDRENVARCIYIGWVGEGPRLTSGRGQGGGAWEIQTDSAWTREKSLRPGILATFVRPSGFNAAGIKPQLTYSGAGFLTPTLPLLDSNSLCLSLESAMTVATTSMQSLFSSAGIDATPRLYREAGGFVFQCTTSGVGAITAALTVGEQSASGASNQSSDPRTATARIEMTPTALIYMPWAASSIVTVDSVTGLPASWAPVPSIDLPHTTSLQYVLIGDLDGDRRLILEPTAHSAATATVPLPYLTTTNRVLTEKGADVANFRWLTRALNLRLIGKVVTGHWYRGLQRAVIQPSDALDCGLDARSWDFDTHGDDVVSATVSGPNERTWYLDGRRTVEDLVSDELAFNGIVIRPAMATETVAATFTAGNYVTRSTWGRSPAGIVNVLQVKGPETILLQDQQSVSRFGQQRQITVNLPETDDPRVARPDPMALAWYCFGRILSLWNQPTFVRTLNVSLEYMHTVHIGDYVTVSDWATPNGSGGRGPSGITCQVIGREIDLSPGNRTGMALTVMSYWQDLVHPIAPACKVGSISGAQLTMSAAYLAGTSTPGDYAGSNLSTYPFVTNDGGVSLFAIGDLVKLRRINVDTVIEETGFTITATNPLAKTINVAPNPATTSPAISGQEWDLVFDDYGNGAATTANMEDFAWVGSHTTNVIGTSTDSANLWAP